MKKQEWQRLSDLAGKAYAEGDDFTEQGENTRCPFEVKRVATSWSPLYRCQLDIHLTHTDHVINPEGE